MTDTNDTQLQRLFAQEPLPASDPALVAAVIAGVHRERRNARIVSIMLGLAVLLVAAALAPLVTTYISQAFGSLQLAAVRSSHFPLVTTALMALASIGAAAWATRN